MDMTITADVRITKTLFELNDNGDLLFSPSIDESVKVTPSLCFPWMKKNEYISIRDEDSNEVFLIKELSQLDEESKKAVSESLIAASFMMKILAIKEINDEFEIRNWKVITKQGPYTFQTQIDYWPQVFNKTTIIIRDITGNIFYVNDPLSLDDKSQHLLWPFLD